MGSVRTRRLGSPVIEQLCWREAECGDVPELPNHQLVALRHLGRLEGLNGCRDVFSSSSSSLAALSGRRVTVGLSCQRGILAT